MLIIFNVLSVKHVTQDASTAVDGPRMEVKTKKLMRVQQQSYVRVSRKTMTIVVLVTRTLISPAVLAFGIYTMDSLRL